MAAMAVRIGTSGWQYRDWQGTFYPPGLPAKERLSRYATRFSTVEVNSTFYRLPGEDALSGLARAEDVYVYFNNDLGAAAPLDAERMCHAVESRGWSRRADDAGVIVRGRR